MTVMKCPRCGLQLQKPKSLNSVDSTACGLGTLCFAFRQKPPASRMCHCNVSPRSSLSSKPSKVETLIGEKHEKAFLTIDTCHTASSSSTPTTSDIPSVTPLLAHGCGEDTTRMPPSSFLPPTATTPYVPLVYSASSKSDSAEVQDEDQAPASPTRLSSFPVPFQSASPPSSMYSENEGKGQTSQSLNTTPPSVPHRNSSRPTSIVTQSGLNPPLVPRRSTSRPSTAPSTGTGQNRVTISSPRSLKSNSNLNKTRTRSDSENNINVFRRLDISPHPPVSFLPPAEVSDHLAPIPRSQRPTLYEIKHGKTRSVRWSDTQSDISAGSNTGAIVLPNVAASSSSDIGPGSIGTRAPLSNNLNRPTSSSIMSSNSSLSESLLAPPRVPTNRIPHYQKARTLLEESMDARNRTFGKNEFLRGGAAPSAEARLRGLGNERRKLRKARSAIQVGV